MTLRAARILSSETDNTIKQEQNVDVKISVQQQPQKQEPQVQPIQTHIPNNQVMQTYPLNHRVLLYRLLWRILYIHRCLQ